jgi:hypothetical protein
LSVRVSVRKIARGLVHALAAFVLTTSLANASVSIAIPFDDLIHGSAAAVVVTPTFEKAVWEGGRILTYTAVRVDTLVAGSLDGEQELWIRTRGGAIGHVGQSVEGEPTLTVGTPTLLFVRRSEGAPFYVVTARAQGQFPVVFDGQELRVHRSSAVGAIVAPRTPTPPVLAAETLHGLKVRDAEATIEQAWGRLHGP